MTGRETLLMGTYFPRWQFTLTYGGSSWLRDQTQNIIPDPTMNGRTEMQAISSLFLACQGSYGEFFYDDPDDDSRANQGFAIGVAGQFTYPVPLTWGNGPFNPPFVTLVGFGVNVITSITQNGITVPSADYSLDATFTKVTFTNAVGISTGDVFHITFSFYYRCRFLDDTLDFNEWASNLWEAKEVIFETVKP